MSAGYQNALFGSGGAVVNAPKPAGKSPAKATPAPARTPGGAPGVKQMDGTVTTQFSKPSKSGSPMRGRPAVPDRSSDTGMETAMGKHADQIHPGKWNR